MVSSMTKSVANSVEFTGAMRQGDTPDWAPLLKAIGDDLTRDFMRWRESRPCTHD